HTFGKAHGAANPAEYVGPDPEAAPLQEMGLGWMNAYKNGNGDATITSGLEGAWTATPITWDNSYLETLFKYEWKQTKSPAGATQWIPTDADAAGLVPDAHDPNKRHAPVMFTTDLALRTDPIYEPIARRFMENPDQFADAFARAWFKLTHRDMGPIARYLGAEVPAEQLIWQDPVPAVQLPLVNQSDIGTLKAKVLASGISVSDLVFTAWASASTFRGTDKRGGANGARIRLEPQNSWEANDPQRIARVISALETIQAEFNASGTKVSLADLIVLGGCAAIEQAAKAGGVTITVPFTPGRTDATAAQTDAASFAVLEPTTDGFRNYLGKGHNVSAEQLLIDKALLLNLTAPQMAVLVAGLRALDANSGQSDLGVLTDRKGVLTNDFFVNLLDINTTWAPVNDEAQTFQGNDRQSGASKWTASRVDLVFGSNSELRALAEVYASDDAKGKFVSDFVSAWDKVMMLDRFELA
ncbi:MAG: peroxidase family protein, partial [Actinomycetales bacterium]